MQVTRKIAHIDTTGKMTVAFDVSKDKLNFYSEVLGKISGTSCRETQDVEGEIRNRTHAILSCLRDLRSFASERGYKGIHVVCEPTGSYSDSLLRLARQKGHSTAYVNGESVCKARIIENNDSGKDDIKDPRIIYMLSVMGKEQVYRSLPAEYQYLRELNRMYGDMDVRRKQAKCLIHALLRRLFCDYPMSKDFFYMRSGQALLKLYSCNPHRIASVSYGRFSSTMRKHCPVTEMSLRKLHDSACQCALHAQSELELSALEQRLQYANEDYQHATVRWTRLREQIAEVYAVVRRRGDSVPIADGKVFTEFQLGRFLGETGPLNDFPKAHTLHKYGGMNLRKRESGYFKGKVKFSKKGRTHMRGVTGKLAFRLVRDHEIFGPYRRRLKQQGTAGNKIIANVERRLVEMLYAMGTRRESFCMQRFDSCESQYRMAA
ncbi:MAG: transposase [Chitinivibrionales bacterium]|nr:transposase [Chitinivibrionales bacterium]